MMYNISFIVRWDFYCLIIGYTEEKLLPDEELNLSSQAYDDNEDDYYYYYYYESDGDKGPSIPDLSTQQSDTKSDYFDSKDNTYVSPFESTGKVAEEETADFNYEKDYVEVAEKVQSKDSDDKASLEAELANLKAEFSTVLLENEALKEQTSRLSFVEEDNEKLAKQVEEYGNVLEENNDLRTQLLEIEAKSELSHEEAAHLKELDEQLSILNEENATEKAKNELLEQQIAELTSQQTDLETTKTQLQEELDKSHSLIETLQSENAVFVAKIDDMQAALKVSDESKSEEKLMIEENIRMIKELEEELNQSKQLETELTKRYENEIETNKTIIMNKEQELTEMNERISQTEALEKELAELRENQKAIYDLQQELSNMRQQQVEVTTSLTELASEKSRATRLEKEVAELKGSQTPEVSSLQAELAQVKEELRLANLKAEQNGSMNQSDIAHVMLEAQAKARQIVDVANYEAKRRVADSEMELSAVSQEARNYYRKLEKIKAESEVVFSELLRKLESIGDIDRL
ncbi:MAG: hypothetical protein RR968_00840 [Vagococcus sp.]